MNFKIEDEPFDPLNKVPSAVSRALEVVGELEDGKLIPSSVLASRVGVGANSWMAYCNHQLLRPYKVLVHHGGTNKNLYGNRATIKAYREKVAS